MNIVLIFIWVWLAFLAAAFWESSVEGRNAWAKKSIGWKIKITKKNTLTKYHFFVNIMGIFALTLPLIIYGWDIQLFGILVSAYFTGIIIEDFSWFVVNPKVKFKEFFSSFTDYYPWLKFKGRKIIPLLYIFNIIIALLSWYFLWRV